MNLTVIIPTSPIPSHPSTAILDETIANVRMYTGERILILFDGVHETLEHRTDDYFIYRMKVIEKIEQGYYGYCTYLDFKEHTHQAKMTRFVIDYYVDTPLILFCEHDTSPIGDIPFNEICELVEHSEINYMRFNIFHEIPREHIYLMIGEGEKDGIRYTKTIQWSQRPHVAKTSFYRDILENHFGKEHKTMIEDVMHGVVQDQWHQFQRDMGLTIYTPEGNQLRSYHSDGRGTDTKIIEA